MKLNTKNFLCNNLNIPVDGLWVHFWGGGTLLAQRAFHWTLSTEHIVSPQQILWWLAMEFLENCLHDGWVNTWARFLAAAFCLSGLSMLETSLCFSCRINYEEEYMMVLPCQQQEKGRLKRANVIFTASFPHTLQWHQCSDRRNPLSNEVRCWSSGGGDLSMLQLNCMWAYYHVNLERTLILKAHSHSFPSPCISRIKSY